MRRSAPAKSAVLETFAATYTYSLQQMLYAIGSALLDALPAVCEVRLSLPNKHHYLVDLAPFGLANDREVYLAGDRPYGLIEGSRAGRRRAGARHRLGLNAPSELTRERKPWRPGHAAAESALKIPRR